MYACLRRGAWLAALGVAASWGEAPAHAQVVERNATVTGPRGRSIERHTRTEKSPGVVDRRVDVRRPGGEFHAETRVVGPRAAGQVGRPPQMGRGGGPPRVIEREYVERDVVIERPSRGPSFGFFLGGPVLPTPPPPPPIYIGPPPIYVAPPPPVVVYQPPTRYAPAPPPAPRVVFDPVADAMGRLRSSHDNSRRDGALSLGRLGDARAVPAPGRPAEERLEARRARGRRLGAGGDRRPEGGRHAGAGRALRQEGGGPHGGHERLSAPPPRRRPAGRRRRVGRGPAAGPGLARAPAGGTAGLVAGDPTRAAVAIRRPAPAPRARLPRKSMSESPVAGARRPR